MLSLLAAANANVAELFLYEGDTTRLHAARFVLELILTSGVSAPHRANESGLVFSNGEELLIPAQEDFIEKLDHDKRIIKFNLPDGLLE